MYILSICRYHCSMYCLSADLFQSERMLDHIVINKYFAILQTPINHCCNTLQAAILQFAIYLYCRVEGCFIASS